MSGKAKLGPKENPVGRKAGVPYNPSNSVISRVMGEFLAYLFDMKKRNIQNIFSREKKKLSNFKDCKEFLENKMKQKKI